MPKVSLNFTQEIPKSKFESIIYGDGQVAAPKDDDTRYESNVISINDSSPGPTLIVPEHALVTVLVKNEMPERSTTIHWHGFDMKNAWYYDGSPTSQCPILPKMSFTYRFQATTSGNKWYHAHLGQQRADGLFGMFIIERNDGRTLPAESIKPIMIHEYHPYSSDLQTNESEGNSKSTSLHYYQKYFRQDGSSLTSRHYETTMINGRGNFKMLGGQQSGFTPLEVIRIQGDNARLLVCNFGAAWSHEFQVEDHVLVIEEVDSNRIQPDGRFFTDWTWGKIFGQSC